MIERWSCDQNKFIESSEKIERFLDALEAVCKAHGLSIGHDDGPPTISNFNERDIEWLRAANSDFPAPPRRLLPR